MALAIPIIGELVGIVQTWLKGKQVVQAARDERAAEVIKQQGNWEEIMATGSVTSWKDEWLTIMVSIPLMGAFIPSATPYITAGFEALDHMPGWYKTAVGVVFSASFGVRSVIGLMREKEPSAVK